MCKNHVEGSPRPADTRSSGVMGGGTASSTWTRSKVPEPILDSAREMRKKPTKAEAMLWENLRSRRLAGLKFRRQQPFEGYILDFYCDKAKLGVEVDGRYHQRKDQKSYDEQRTQYLHEFGINIIRFTNDEVIKNVQNVLKNIKAAASKRINP